MAASIPQGVAKCFLLLILFQGSLCDDEVDWDNLEHGVETIAKIGSTVEEGIRHGGQHVLDRVNQIFNNLVERLDLGGGCRDETGGYPHHPITVTQRVKDQGKNVLGKTRGKIVYNGPDGEPISVSGVTSCGFQDLMNECAQLCKAFTAFTNTT